MKKRKIIKNHKICKKEQKEATNSMNTAAK
jgi:hypothetical protein